MTVHPFLRAAGAPCEASGGAGVTAFPVIPRGTALLRRAVTMRDIDAGVTIIHHPRTGHIRHDITRRDARAARSRLRRLREGHAQWRGVVWFDAPPRLPFTLAFSLTAPAPPGVALATGAAAGAVVVALLLAAWS